MLNSCTFPPPVEPLRIGSRLFSGRLNLITHSPDSAVLHSSLTTICHWFSVCSLFSISPISCTNDLIGVGRLLCLPSADSRFSSFSRLFSFDETHPTRSDRLQMTSSVDELEHPALRFPRSSTVDNRCRPDFDLTDSRVLRFFLSSLSR